MDADYRQAVERLLVHKCFTKERLEEFINATSINVLARVCAHGKPLQWSYLQTLAWPKESTL